MSKRILCINSSVFGAAGVSSDLNHKLVVSLTAEYNDCDVIQRDLVGDPLPYFDGNYLQALSTLPEQRNAEQAAIVVLADSLIAELQSADILVLAAPMYNFGVPAQLKSWFDYVARAKETFEYTADGPKGLLSNKTVYITATRGGLHKGTASDSQTAFLTTFFNFLGLSDVRFIYAEGLNMQGKKEQSVSLAELTIQKEVFNHA